MDINEEEQCKIEFFDSTIKSQGDHYSKEDLIKLERRFKNDINLLTVDFKGVEIDKLIDSIMKLLPDEQPNDENQEEQEKDNFDNYNFQENCFSSICLDFYVFSFWNIPERCPTPLSPIFESTRRACQRHIFRVGADSG